MGPTALIVGAAAAITGAVSGAVLLAVGLVRRRRHEIPIPAGEGVSEDDASGDGSPVGAGVDRAADGSAPPDLLPVDERAGVAGPGSPSTAGVEPADHDGTSFAARVAPRLGRRQRGQRPVLRTMTDIRHFFRTTETPIYYVAATAFNLLGIDKWVRNLTYVNYYDSFDGTHPNIFVPAERPFRAFQSIEEICNYLLAHKEVRDMIAARRPDGATSAGKACFLMFDDETEQLAREAGLDVAFPSAALRHRLDSKVITTELGNEAGVPSVPNVLGRATSYRELLALADGAGLGHDLVVQTPYGDSGQTTFFVRKAADWRRHEKKMAGESLKIMRRIRPLETTIEAVVTRHGTVVGPLLTELVGFDDLTPYGGGWCGDEVSDEALTPEIRAVARARTHALGERLRQEGYRGYFDLDFLIDLDSGELWLGELNPRVTGASPMTNVCAVAYGDVPLFLFHLLEFMDVDYELDVEELNERWASMDYLDTWAQFVMKETGKETELLTRAPATGIWRLEPDGQIYFHRHATDWHGITDERDAFYLRIAGPGSYRYPGADLGILVSRGRFMTDDGALTERAKTWIAGFKTQFAGVGLAASEKAPIPRPDPFGFKIL
jgi:biotin carboxylase